MDEALENKGFSFSIKFRQVKRPWLLGNRYAEVEKTLTIRHNTLAVLDLISKECQRLKFDPHAFETKDLKVFAEARKLVSEHSRTMAKIIAIASMGEECFVITPHGDYQVREKEIKRLQDQIYVSLGFDELTTICDKITGHSDLANFINSIRLMGTIQTN